MAPIICAPAWPDCTRRSHCAKLVGSDLNAAGISRVPLLPSWWQDMHVPDLIVRTQSACDFTLGEMPLPWRPVPGNSLLSGTLSSDSQYPAG